MLFINLILFGVLIRVSLKKSKRTDLCESYVGAVNQNKNFTINIFCIKMILIFIPLMYIQGALLCKSLQTNTTFKWSFT